MSAIQSPLATRNSKATKNKRRENMIIEFNKTNKRRQNMIIEFNKFKGSRKYRNRNEGSPRVREGGEGQGGGVRQGCQKAFLGGNGT